MTGINSDTESQKWIIAPETSFLRLAEDMAQSAAVNSVEFLERKAEVKTALDTAFKDAEEVFAQYLPSAINRAVSTEQFRSSLPSEPMALGELIGHTGFLASRAKKAKRKTAIHAAYDSRRAMVELKRFHIRIYDRTLGQIGTARRNASIGIPRLTNDTRYKLEYLYGLERAQLTEAVSENLNYIAEIKAFHEAVRARFGMALKIFGQTQTALTEEQRVHFDALKVHEQDIRQAQSLVRSIALLGDDDEPLELDLEREWDHGR